MSFNKSLNYREFPDHIRIALRLDDFFTTGLTPR